MDKKIIKKLKQDEHYYGDYGKQFLSNSDISILLKNPKMLREPKPKTSAIVVGGGIAPKTEINYIPEKTSFLVTAMLSMGAGAIDVDGIVDVVCEE